MRKILLCALFLILITFTGQAQIQLTPVAEADIKGLTSSPTDYLKNKLSRMLTQQGVLAKFGDSRFVLAAKVNVLDKEVLGTAPTRICYRLTIQLAIGDGLTGTCFGTTAVDVKGVGSNETKAVMSAIRSLNVKNPEFCNLIDKGTQRIYQYYEENIGGIIKNAKNLISIGKYDQAILEMAVVPKEIKEYQQVKQTIFEANRHRINRNAQKILMEAKTKWASDPNLDNSIKVMAIVRRIEPTSQCFADAQNFISEVQTRIESIHQQKHDDQMLREKQASDLEMAKVKAAEKKASDEAEIRKKEIDLSAAKAANETELKKKEMELAAAKAANETELKKKEMELAAANAANAAAHQAEIRKKELDLSIATAANDAEIRKKELELSAANAANANALAASQSVSRGTQNASQIIRIASEDQLLAAEMEALADIALEAAEDLPDLVYDLADWWL